MIKKTNKVKRVKGLMLSFDEAGDTTDKTTIKETLDSLIDRVIK